MAKNEKRDAGLYDVVLVSPIDIPQEIDYLRKSNLVGAFFGGPGIGKTASIKGAARGQADDLGLKFVENPTPNDWRTPGNYCYMVVLTSQLSEEEAMGIPFKFQLSDGTEITRYLPTELFPQYGTGMIVFDEFPNGRSHVQNAMQQMLLEHKAGNYAISPDIQFVLAGNRPGDNCGTYNIPDALKNRVAWYEVTRPTIQQWLDKMEQIGQPINSVMAAWLLSVGSPYFDNHGASAEQYAYGTPRSITHASKAIDGVSDNKVIERRVGSFIGKAAGQNLVAFLELTKTVDINALLKSPVDIHKYEDNIGLLYSISLSLIDRAIETPTITDNVLAILLETKKNEYGVFIMKGLMGKWGKSTTLERIMKCKNGNAVTQKYYKILKQDATTK